MIPFAANAAAMIAEAFEWPGQPPKVAPSLWGICSPSSTWFLGPTRVFIQNEISISSAISAQLTVVSLLYNGLNCLKNYPFPLWDRVPHLTHGT